MRKMVDCRTTPSVINCTLTIAGEEEEVLDAAYDHMISKHGHEPTPQLREEIRADLVDAEPSMA